MPGRGPAHPGGKGPPPWQLGCWVPGVGTTTLCPPNPTPLGQAPSRPPKTHPKGAPSQSFCRPKMSPVGFGSQPSASGICGATSPPKTPQNTLSLLTPGPKSCCLPQTEGWELPPAPCPDIWVSLSLSHHLKTFFSRQKQLGAGGGLLLSGLGAVFAAQSRIWLPIPAWMQLLGCRALLVTPSTDLGVSLFPGAAFPPEEQLFPGGVGQGGDGHGSSCRWGWGRGGGCVMCVHKHFWGPSPTSRDWEKFTYPAHFHMSWLRLAEATICAAVRRSGFFPAPERVGFSPWMLRGRCSSPIFSPFPCSTGRLQPFPASLSFHAARTEPS